MISTLNDYLGSAKQRIEWAKTASRTTVAAMPFSLFDLAGQPGAGALAVGNTANGIVPTDAISGYPVINAFGGSATGYLSKVEFNCSVTCRFAIFDRLFSCGAYNYNASTTLASQPSYSGRVPGGNYNGLEIWVEQVTAATGNQAVTATYTDQDGNTGATTGAVGIGGAPTVGRMWQLPLASGDNGVQKIESITGTVATAGTFNVHVMRPIWTSGSVAVAGLGDVHDFLKTGLPQIYADSALFVMMIALGTSSGYPELNIEIANN